MTKHSRHLKTLEKCRKYSPAARVRSISLVISNARLALTQCKTRLRLLYLLTQTHWKDFVQVLHRIFASLANDRIKKEVCSLAVSLKCNDNRLLLTWLGGLGIYLNQRTLNLMYFFCFIPPRLGTK